MHYLRSLEIHMDQKSVTKLRDEPRQTRIQRDSGLLLCCAVLCGTGL